MLRLSSLVMPVVWLCAIVGVDGFKEFYGVVVGNAGGVAVCVRL